jgi:hypothetical protein
MPARSRAPWRAVAVWLLLLVMLLGPLGTAIAANDTCTPACPCVGESELEGEDGCDDTHEGEGEHEGGGECGDDCRTCCTGVLVLMSLALRVPPHIPPPAAATLPHGACSITLGVHTGVFRPPR